MAKKKSEKKSKVISIMVQRILMLTIFLFGLSLLLYPFVSQGINDYFDQLTVQRYQKEASKKNDAEIQKIQQKMEDQNQRAQEEKNPGSKGEPFSQQRRQKEKKIKPTSSYVDEHMAGTIIIPDIDVKLPIFDITNDFFLSKGATILEGTSSLMGGLDSHAVISSHRGLEDAQLFTKLPDLKKNQLFFIKVLNKTHAYKVDQIKVIEPTETKDLMIVEGMDYVTLMTCTPYGVNSHRLLVRGYRVPYTKEMSQAIRQVNQNKRRNFILLVIGLIAGLVILVGTIKRIIYFGRIGRNKYNLNFYLKDLAGDPLINVSLQLLGKKGKLPVVMDDQKVIAVSDSSGKVVFPLLYGKKYTVAILENHFPLAQAKVKKVKDRHFTLSSYKKNSVIEKNELKISRDRLFT